MGLWDACTPPRHKHYRPRSWDRDYCEPKEECRPRRECDRNRCDN